MWNLFKVNIKTLPKKMKFSNEDFFSKCDQIWSFLRIWSHLLKKSLMGNFIFCVVKVTRKMSMTLVKKYYSLRYGWLCKWKNEWIENVDVRLLLSPFPRNLCFETFSYKSNKKRYPKLWMKIIFYAVTNNQFHCTLLRIFAIK